MTPTRTNPKRNHHILPKLYLSGFIITPGQPFIWAYKRGEKYNPGNGKITNNPCKHSIGRLTARDFYAYPVEDGTKDFDSYENFLEKLEKPADQVFRKLRSRQTITSKEKQIFCLYLVQMVKRVPAHRKELSDIAKIVATTYEMPQEAMARLNLPNDETTRRRVKQLTARLSQQEGFDNRIHLKVLSLVTSSLLLDVLAKMSWRFFVAPPNHRFLTGDNPVFFTRPIGLDKADSEISFPISSEICLAASNRVYPEGFIEAPTQIVKELNRRTATHALQFLYSSQSEPWIVTLFNKEHHVLHRIH